MILPLFAMACLTFGVAFVLLAKRIKATRCGDVSMKYHRASQGEAPEYVVIPARNLANLFEMPILFYVVGILTLVLGIQSPKMVILAWIYVVLRVIHSVIHLTYNNVIHRLVAYAASTICLMAMWGMLLITRIF